MTFDARQLVLVDDKLDYSMWVYDTADAIGTVAAAGYITDGSSSCFGMRVGDTLIVRRWADVTTKASLTAQYLYLITAVGASTTAAAEDTLSGRVTVLEAASASEYVMLSSPALSANGADAATHAWVIPFAYSVEKIHTILLGGALATADFVLTASIAAAAITNGAITVTQSGSAQFDIDTATPTAANTGAAGTYIKVVGSGSSTGNRTVSCTILIKRTGA